MTPYKLQVHKNLKLNDKFNKQTTLQIQISHPFRQTQ